MICEVDCRVHDACAVGADGVGDVSDADRVEVLVVALRLHEYLLQMDDQLVVQFMQPSVRTRVR